MVLWRAVSSSDILKALARLTQPKGRPPVEVHVLGRNAERGSGAAAENAR